MNESFQIKLTLTAVYTPCEEGGFSVKCAEVPGAISQGETTQEALANLIDAVYGIFAANKQTSEEVKRITTAEDLESIINAELNKLRPPFNLPKICTWIKERIRQEWDDDTILAHGFKYIPEFRFTETEPIVISYHLKPKN